MSANFRARRFLRGLGYGEDVRHQVWIGSFAPSEQQRLFLPGVMPKMEESEFYLPTSSANALAAGLSPMDRAIYTYINTYMTDDILAKVDRASMANSLEVRAPFLDSEFAAFALGIPPELKLRGFSTKWILKRALKGRLPRQILRKKKQGFAVPVAQWLKTDLKGLMEKAFDKKKIEKEGIFDYNYIDNAVRAFVSNKKDTRKEIWALFMFEMWYDKWMR
jgi:asparagine synthase (glutamine-hydrolysing)